MTPFFSIVTPVFNRQDLVARAIRSTLGQQYPHFEHIIVDDGSTDGSVEVARGFGDSRVRVVQHEVNRGVSPARNSGVAAARGDWVVFLDSDDELLPGVLAVMAARVSQVPDDIGRVVFMNELAEGGFSPEPPLSEGVWDYLDYIRWSSRITGPSDFNNCIRRQTFETLAFSNDRALETLYHLEFASRFKTRTCADVVARVHSDAANRSSNYTVQGLRRVAPDNFRARLALLERHGLALKRVSPDRYAAELRIAAIYSFLAGRRLTGLRLSLELFGERPSPTPLILLLLGLAGPRVMAWSMVLRSRLRRGARSQE